MKKTTPIPRIGLLSGLVLTALLIADGPSSAAADDAEGFVSIFDGRTLAGWEGDPEHWTVEDGAITGKATLARPMKTNNFIVWRQGDLDDFELRVEYRIDGGNSGIQYRSFEKPAEWPKWVVGGYQADVDATDKYTGILYGERYRGILSQRGEKTVIGDDHKPEVVGRVGDGDELKAAFRPGDWNHYRIVAHGYHFIHEINGRVMCEVTDEDQAERRRGGILALQLHAGADMKVQFRNLRLKRLPMQDGKKVVFVAGPVSHGYGEHEHYAGCLLLAKALNDNVPGVYATVYRDGWPADPTAFDNADAVVLFSDGGGGHPMLKHLEVMDKLARSGVGLACLHYAVEVPKGEAGDSFLRWIGGYFETFWSVNPWWTPDFKKFPDHPIARGVRPFSIEDEWYYHMRFGKDTAGVTPILTAVPPDQTRQGKDGARSGNEAVRARMGMAETVAWAFDRKAVDGKGRGFGFTGAHVHWNWGHDDFRKLVLNAIVWVAGAEVPADGVTSKTPTLEDLEANQDQKPPKNFKRDAIRERLQSWHKGQ